MTRRVYRARAFYSDEDDVVTRHFLTKRSRDRWAANRRDGYPEQPPTFHDDDGLPAIPPASRVDVDESDPIVFPS